jgi:hypothetical protein
VEPPTEWVVVSNILAICDRFKCTPSVAVKEDISVLTMMDMEQIMRPRDE